MIFADQRGVVEACWTQRGGQGCGTELTFALTYEVNMMYGFDVDEEFRPVGCAGTCTGTTARGLCRHNRH